MAEEKFFLPECRYQPTLLTCWENDPNSHIGKIVHVLPKEFLSATKTLNVAGENFVGIIEESELSLYPITYFEGSTLPKFLPKMFGHCMTAKITGFSNGKFILSRRASMQEALSFLNIGDIVESKKTSCIPKIVFVDIGAGISAIIPISEVTSSCIDDVAPIFEGIDYIPVKIIGKSPNYENKYIASYKQTIPPKLIVKGDIVLGKATNLTQDGTGVYVELSPTQSGIVDIEGLTVVSKDQIDEYSYPDIVLGNTYSFLVHRVKESNKFRNKTHYSLRLV